MYSPIASPLLRLDAIEAFSSTKQGHFCHSQVDSGRLLHFSFSRCVASAARDEQRKKSARTSHTLRLRARCEAVTTAAASSGFTPERQFGDSNPTCDSKLNSLTWHVLRTTQAYGHRTGRCHVAAVADEHRAALGSSHSMVPAPVPSQLCCRVLDASAAFPEDSQGHTYLCL